MSTLVVQGIVPRNFNEMSVQSRNISFSWMPPITNIPIIGYTVNCDDGNPPVDVSGTNAIIIGLTPFTYLSCVVYTRVEGNRGENSSMRIVRTAEESKNIGHVDCILMLLSYYMYHNISSKAYTLPKESL